MIRAAFFIVLLVASGLVAATGDDRAKEMEIKAWKAIETGGYAQGSQLLSTLARWKDAPAETAWQYRLGLSIASRSAGQTNSAADAIRSLSSNDRNQPAVRLEMARLALAVKNAKSALTLLTGLESEADPSVQSESKFQIAKLLFDEERYADCVERCVAAISAGENYEKKCRTQDNQRKLDDYGDARAPSGYEQYVRYRTAQVVKEAKELLDKARRMTWREKFGEEYLIYIKAREAQGSGRWLEAIQLYQKVQCEVLGDAARCYGAACRASLGALDSAKREYRAFIEAAPEGLYRGEALLDLARLEYLTARSSRDLEIARKTLLDAVAWGQKVAQNGAVSLGRFEELLTLVPPPGSYTAPRQTTAYGYGFGAPEHLINRVSCGKWYPQFLDLHAHLLLGLVEFELRHPKAAVESLDAADTINGGRMITQTGARHHLFWGVDSGGFLVPSEVWADITSRHIKLACFYLVTGDIDTASAVLEGTPAVGLRLEDHASMQFALGCAASRTSNDAKAIDHYSTFTRDLRTSKLAPLALIHLGNIMAGQPDQLVDMRRVYRQVATNYAGSSYAPRALLCLAVALANGGRFEEADSVIGELLVAHPNTYYADSAKSLREFLYLDEGKRIVSLPDPNKLKLPAGTVPVVAHLVFPGAKPVSFDYSTLKNDNIMYYRLSYSTRSRCIRINSWTMRLSESEPQIPRTGNRILSYVRVPVLFRNLKGDY